MHNEHVFHPMHRFRFMSRGGVGFDGFFRFDGLSRGYFQENFHKFAVPPIAKCRDACDNIGIMNLKTKG